MLLRNAAGYVVTVRTLDEPDGTDLYVLAPRPDQRADHLYGAAHVDNDRPMPDVPFPVIPYGRDHRHPHLLTCTSTPAPNPPPTATDATTSPTCSASPGESATANFARHQRWPARTVDDPGGA